MTVRLTTDKMIEIKTLCIQMVNSKFITIRKFAKLIGMMCHPSLKNNLIGGLETLKQASNLYKSVILISLLKLIVRRGQTIHLVEIQDISFGSNDIQIATNHLIKQSRPGYHLAPITFKQYDKDPKLCIVRTFREYLDRTAALRGKVTKLLVTTQKPHPAASRDTVSRWVKSLLTSAGVDKCFKPHSVRSASVSKAKEKGVKLETILKSAGWSNARTFARFYNKPIADDHSFENAILNNWHESTDPSTTVISEEKEHEKPPQCSDDITLPVPSKKTGRIEERSVMDVLELEDSSKTLVKTSKTKKPLNKKPKKSSDNNGIDISKLTPKNIDSLRGLLGIDSSSFNDFEQFSPQDYPRMQFQIDANDISDTELAEENVLPPPDFTSMFDTDSNNNQVSSEFGWTMPKLKAPEMGEPVSEPLAKLVNVASTKQCEMDGVVTKYKVPSNCDLATPPTVNQEIWKIMNKGGHLNDKLMVDIQNLVAAGIGSVLKLVNLLKDQSLGTEAKGVLSDTLTILGQTQYNLSMRRKYMIRPALKKKYAGLCNLSTEVTKKLFGDHIDKEIKSCETLSSIGKDSYPQRGTFARGRGRFQQRCGGYGSYYQPRYQPYEQYRPRGAGSWRSSRNTEIMTDTLESLGFVLNKEKSVLKPCQQILFFGFILDSVEFKVYLTERKIQKILLKAKILLSEGVVVILYLASFIGLIVNAFYAVFEAKLHFRDLE
ncbi:hypothetical protein MAR_020678 [Mya arenaria]|uniref:Tyr recombinase domain-containing protein n=1 Tax=Mya arenaria TaxID=6604 RepID=A0ABY7E7X4_MYAAR|nr:hypothetical protein MAR_020678 [Mya arenaria]